jgi:cytochrome c5
VVTRTIAAALLAGLALAGCRTGGATGKRERDPAFKALTDRIEASEIAALASDPARTLVSERCLLCHGAGLITQQRKDAAAWGRTVTQMRTWGTPIQDDDQTAIVEYLTKHYGPGNAKH